MFQKAGDEGMIIDVKGVMEVHVKVYKKHCNIRASFNFQNIVHISAVGIDC